MSLRKPFRMRTFMLAYNAVQVVFNMTMLLNVRSHPLIPYPLEHIRYQIRLLPQCLHAIQSQNAWTNCVTSDRNTRRILLVYLHNKYFDLLDTVICVLRKKDAQVSYLHVHHHCAVVFWTTLSMHYSDGSVESVDAGITLIITSNATVHVCMYAYYFATIYSAAMRGRFAVFKKRITQLQLVCANHNYCLSYLPPAFVHSKNTYLHFQIQFVLNCAAALREITAICPQGTLWISVGGLCQNAYFLFLFGRLYAAAYRKRTAVRRHVVY